MFQKIQNWLVRQRDKSTVSYSRFGRPGDEEEDKPPPTTIIVAPFNENSPEYILFGICHVQKAAVYFAAFGMAISILMFISMFFEFDWYSHYTGVDVGAVFALFAFLAIGVLTHYYVILGVKRQLSRYLLPFIAVYTIVCTSEAFTCIGLVFKMAETQNDPRRSDAQRVIQLNMEVHHSPVEVKNTPFGLILFGMLVILGVQTIMLTAVMRCRQFLSAKQEHEMAMKIAKKSKIQYPSIQIVVSTAPGPYTTTPTTTTTNHSGTTAAAVTPTTTAAAAATSSASVEDGVVPPAPQHNGKANSPPLESIII